MPKIEKGPAIQIKKCEKNPARFIFLTRPIAITQSGPLPDYLAASSPHYITGYRVLRHLLNSAGTQAP